MTIKHVKSIYIKDYIPNYNCSINDTFLQLVKYVITKKFKNEDDVCKFLYPKILENINFKVKQRLKLLNIVNHTNFDMDSINIEILSNDTFDIRIDFEDNDIFNSALFTKILAFEFSDIYVELFNGNTYHLKDVKYILGTINYINSRIPLHKESCIDINRELVNSVMSYFVDGSDIYYSMDEQVCTRTSEYISENFSEVVPDSKIPIKEVMKFFKDIDEQMNFTFDSLITGVSIEKDNEGNLLLRSSLMCVYGTLLCKVPAKYVRNLKLGKLLATSNIRHAESIIKYLNNVDDMLDILKTFRELYRYKEMLNDYKESYLSYESHDTVILRFDKGQDKVKIDYIVSPDNQYEPFLLVPTRVI